MNRMDRLNTFDLDNDQTIHDKVDAVSEFDLLAVVNYGQANLTGNGESSFPKLMQQAGVIRTFQQSPSAE